MPNCLTFIAASSILAFVFGCTNGTNDQAIVPVNSGAPQPPASNPDDCAGAFAQVMPSYAVSPAVQASGGFTVDANGMVLGLMPDVHQLEPLNDVPYLIQTAPLNGAASTVYTYPTGAAMASLQSDATSIYFFASVSVTGGTLYRVPRAGGAAAALYTSTSGTFASLVLDEANVYFLTNDAIMSVPKAGGEVKSVLAAVQRVERSNLMTDGTALYWTETASDVASRPEAALKTMAFGTTAVVRHGSIPASFVIRQMDVSTLGVVVFSTIEVDGTTKLYEISLQAAAPFMLDGSGGNPLRVSGGDVYYGSPTGLKRVPTTNHGVYDPQAITPPVPGVSAIAVSDTDVYYATGTCIHRQPK